MSTEETDDSYDTESDSFVSFSDGSEESESENENKAKRHKRSDLENSLHEKNKEIATTLKTITVGNLTPATQRRFIVEQPTDNRPDWVKRATKARAERIAQSGDNIQPIDVQTQPEWIEKAKQAQISRDLRGLDRFLNKKAPELPPEPEWFRKACKRRDLSTLIYVNEKVHVSNVETPSWVKSSAAQKILNSFLQEDEGVIPDWMKKGVKMTTNEKNILLEQLAKLKEILEQEKKLTGEKETLLASFKDSLQIAEQKLDESVISYRSLRENRKDENVQSFIDSSNDIFSKNVKFMNSTKEKFDLTDSVASLVEKQNKKEELHRQNRPKKPKKKKSSSKIKKPSSKKKSSRIANTDSSKDDIKQHSLIDLVDEKSENSPRRKRRTKEKSEKTKLKKKNPDESKKD